MKRPSLRDRFVDWRSRSLDAIYGRRPKRFANQLDGMQWWPAERLRAWQAEQLRDLVEHARRTVPYYAARLSGGARPTAEGDTWLAQLPILTKEELRSAADRLVVGSSAHLFEGATSGATGTPVRVWHDARFESLVRAVQRRAMGWHGVEPTWPSFYFGGQPPGSWLRARRRLIDGLTGRRCEPAFDMSGEYLGEVVRRLRQHRPRIVFGYTSALWALALHATDAGLRLDDIGVRLVMPISETTTTAHTERLEAVFGAPVMVEYGCVEIGAMAYSCPQGTVHISHELVRFEVVDNDGMPATEGEVVLTPFALRCMPLVRYRLGDRARLGFDPCPCGRHPGLPWIRELLGRSFDQILDKAGKAWNALLLYYAFKEVFDSTVVREFRAVQRVVGEVEIDVLPGPRYTPGFADRFAEAIASRMAGAIEVKISTVDTIVRERSGKLAYFKAELADRN